MTSVCCIQEKSCKYTGRLWQYDSTKCTETQLWTWKSWKKGEKKFVFWRLLEMSAIAEIAHSIYICMYVYTHTHTHTHTHILKHTYIWKGCHRQVARRWSSANNIVFPTNNITEVMLQSSVFQNVEVFWALVFCCLIFSFNYLYKIQNL